jgi:carboxylate-amine ligase
MKMNCIQTVQKIWWDVRHITFPTLEFRICDIPTRVDDTIAWPRCSRRSLQAAHADRSESRFFVFITDGLFLRTSGVRSAMVLMASFSIWASRRKCPLRSHRELLDFVDEVLDPRFTQRGRALYIPCSSVERRLMSNCALDGNLAPTLTRSSSMMNARTP